MAYKWWIVILVGLVILHLPQPSIGQTVPASQPSATAPTTKPARIPRSQEPVGELPYDVTYLFIPGGAADVKLGATITTPKTPGPHPAVVLVSGSGPNDRDETILNHKPFLIWADRLTRAGFTVLRYDKRGIAKSSGDYLHATTADFADDAEAAVKYLRGQADVGMIGMIGHSEGGMIAPMVAARDKDVSWIVMLAGPGVSGARILELQVGASLRLAGFKPEYVASKVALQHELMGLVIAGDRAGIEAAMLKELLGDAQPGAPATRPFQLDVKARQTADQLASPWITYFVKYDPAPALAALKVPVLAVNGSLDFQVDPGVNLSAIEIALSPETKAKSTIKLLPGLNHLFQPAKTGALTEYGTIPTTIDESALKTVVDWCATQAGLRAAMPTTSASP